MSNKIGKFGNTLVAEVITLPVIRDPSPEAQAFMGAIRKKLRGIQFRQSGLSYWAYSVSYTHLRAHETDS